MKLFKRTLCLVLALVMVISVASFTVSANSGEKVMPLITDVVKDDVELYTYLFYMPEDWKSEYNDWGEGYAGIYWWAGSYPADPWPGYAVAQGDAENVYSAQVPVDVSTIIWNNAVDGGSDPTAPEKAEARQIKDLNCEWYEAGDDKYGFYPEGLPNFNNMIYVLDPAAAGEGNEISDAIGYVGDWFYYYGNGQYGPLPTLEEATAAGKVYANGEFPAYGLQLDYSNTKISVGETTVITPDNAAAVATAVDPTIISVTQDETTGVVTVKGLKPGKTSVKFVVTDVESGELEEKEVEIEVVAAKLLKDSASLAAGATTSIRVSGGTAKSFTTSNKKVATVDKNGKVTALKKGNATITVKTTTGQALKFTVKVTSNPKVAKATYSVKVGKKVKIKVNGAVGKVTYKVKKAKIATVNKNGKVTGKKAGSTKVNIVANGVKLKCTVKVTK